MTALTSGHVAMLTKFFVGVCIVSFVNGKSVPVAQPASEPTLLEKIKKEGCMFPPTNLQIPDKCSDLSLSTQISSDLPNNIDFYLCYALLDSTERLCHITKGNPVFGKRVSNALNDSLQSILSISDETFCREMTIIDPDAKYPPAKFMYNKMKTKFCTSICVGMDDKETTQREPICKAIHFAHQQIHAADELQNDFNIQGRHALEENPVEARPAKTSGSNPKLPLLEEPLAPAISQTNQRANAQGLGEESRTSSNTDAASNPKPSEVQSSIGIQPANPNTLQAGEAAPVVQSEPKLPATSATKKEVPIADKAVKPAEEPAVPAETNENDKTNGIDAPKTEQENSNLPLKSEERGEDLKGDGSPNKNDLTDVQEDTPPLTDENDGVDDPMKQEPQFDGDDDDSMLGNGPLEPKDVAEKPPPDEKKVSGVSVQVPQQKIPPAPMMGNFEESEDSHFFAYFMSLSALCILAYVVYHNKRKIIAMAVEGKKSRSTGRRRPNSASYHKLDSNLEEAMSSNLASTNSYVIY